MSRARHVLVLNHFARPRHLPGGTRHVELFSRLDGWQARVIAGDKGLRGSDWHGKDGLLETVRTVPYEANGIARVMNWVSFGAMSFVRGVRMRPLDLVYGSSPHMLSALSGWAIARLRRVPFVLEVRDIWPKVLVDMGTLPATSLIYRALEKLELFLYRHADHIVFMAEGVEGHLLAAGVSPQKIVFIPNGADSADFVPSAPREALRERFGFTGVVAVYAGAHGPANGLDLLLDAAKDVTADVPELSVVLVGDGVVKQQLQERVRSEGIGNVRFLDPIPKDQMPDLLGASDVGVHCLADVELFRTGVSPNKLFDYMAAALPAVTNTPGICTEFVEASEGGIAVPPTGLATALRKLAALTADERSNLGRHGQAFLEANRSRTAMAARLQTLLDALRPTEPGSPRPPKEKST